MTRSPVFWAQALPRAHVCCLSLGTRPAGESPCRLSAQGPCPWELERSRAAALQGACQGGRALVPLGVRGCVWAPGWTLGQGRPGIPVLAILTGQTLHLPAGYHRLPVCVPQTPVLKPHPPARWFGGLREAVRVMCGRESGARVMRLVPFLAEGETGGTPVLPSPSLPTLLPLPPSLPLPHPFPLPLPTSLPLSPSHSLSTVRGHNQGRQMLQTRRKALTGTRPRGHPGRGLPASRTERKKRLLFRPPRLWPTAFLSRQQDRVARVFPCSPVWVSFSTPQFTPGPRGRARLGFPC